MKTYQKKSKGKGERPIKESEREEKKGKYE